MLKIIANPVVSRALAIKSRSAWLFSRRFRINMRIKLDGNKVEVPVLERAPKGVPNEGRTHRQRSPRTLGS